jgi:peptidoglycan/xylan/chitin deacetylase (PgdA/CDA1 family)
MIEAFDRDTLTRLEPFVSPWPKGVRCVVLLTFDVDCDSAWVRRGSTDPITLSMGRFEPNVGLPAILDLMDRYGIKTTFFVPGWVAENYTSMAEDIVRRGHEIGHHGYLHEPGSVFSSRDEEEEAIEKGTEALVRVLGCKPVGYRAPSWEFSPHTISLLEKHGFSYTSDLMDTLLPSYHAIDGRRSAMLNLPVHWTLDDMAHFFYHITARKTMLSCRQVLELYQEEFAGIYAYGGLYTLTMHPQATGRPSRILMMRQFIEYLQSFPDVWITTPAEVVKHWRNAHPNPQ